VHGVSRILKNTLAEVTEHAREEPRYECCGLLGGRDGVITRAFAATNAAADTTRNYEIAPQELFRLMREIRSAGLALMGIYHSHPGGDNEPSPRDIERAFYPAAVYFIVSLQGNAEVVRAFSIRQACVEELKIEIA
jgi:proteasome lid subunit RPN8/RPN11